MPHYIVNNSCTLLVLKARLGDMHTNFPIKSLSKGKDSCHANRQQTKQFIAFSKEENNKKKKPTSSTSYTQL